MYLLFFFLRVPSTVTFKIPTIANIPTKTASKPSTTVNQLQNNMKAASLNDQPNTDQENNKNMGLSNKKEE